jgi:hypothetical protein
LPTNKRKQRKRIKIAKPSDLTVIPEWTAKVIGTSLSLKLDAIY